MVAAEAVAVAVVVAATDATAQPCEPWLQAMRQALQGHADATAAPAMQAYMKSHLPFYGVAAPLRHRLQAEVARAHPCSSTPQLAATMWAFWRQASHREERYAALELARQVPHRRLVGQALLPVYERMVVSAAWWDLVAGISGDGLAALWQAEPLAMKATMRRWAHSDDLWLRRAAMLSQRRAKKTFDAHVFYECLIPSLGDARFNGEFFTRKGMGWALRERSYAAPEEVQAFCAEYASQLSALTVREALRVLRKRAANT